MARSGQVTVTTAGTAVSGPDQKARLVVVKALAGNTGIVYVGNDGAGDVTSGNGFELSTGESVLLQVPNLNELRFDAAEDGDKLCWILVD